MIGGLIALAGFWFGFFTGSPAICFCAILLMYFVVFGSVSYSEE